MVRKYVAKRDIKLGICLQIDYQDCQSADSAEHIEGMAKRPAGGGGGKRVEALSDDAIYERIHDAIGSQALPPGTRLREDEMRRIFGVSRARIRKVFDRLAFSGLVTIEANRGASVYRPTPKDAREIFAARRAIESAVLPMLDGRLGKAERSLLARHVKAEMEAEARRDRAEMVRLSGDFHMRLAEIAGNDIMTRMLRELITREALVILVYEQPGRASCSHHEHQMILDALVVGDGARAVALMTQHLLNVEERLELDRQDQQPVDLAKLFAS
jgi:DNA-binding GntR family transcriptional regulator